MIITQLADGNKRIELTETEMETALRQWIAPALAEEGGVFHLEPVIPVGSQTFTALAVDWDGIPGRELSHFVSGGEHNPVRVAIPSIETAA